MLEKDAEELFKKKPLGYEMKPELEIYTDGFKDGYNKAKEWHNIRENPNDLPTDNSSLYYVLVYSWDFGLSHLYSKYGTYIPTVCEWGGEYFKALDRGAYTNARNIRNCFAWKEIELPKEIKEND